MPDKELIPSTTKKKKKKTGWGVESFLYSGGSFQKSFSWEGTGSNLRFRKTFEMGHDGAYL
jgi:hypothetical protein